MHYSKVLSIAGSDSGGGAGIQADIKSISACGAFAATAITAITAQNTLGVEAVFALPPEIVAAQITAVMNDIGANAIKIGMLQSSEIIECIAQTLAPYSCKNIVLDPVMVSTSGHRLMQIEAIETLKTRLLYSARIITPNIPEAEILLGYRINEQSDIGNCARELSQGKVSVLLKGGHASGAELTDVLYDNESKEIHTFRSNRIATQNTHGTGCSLSSAIAAFLAQNYSLTNAVQAAIDYLHKAIETGNNYSIGAGHGPVHHFYKWWK